MLDFARTPIGKKFFDGTMPRVASSLEDIARELKRQNDLKEEERAPDDVKGIAGEFITGD